MPAATPAGNYLVQVNVRGAGSSVEQDASTRISYLISSPVANPATGVTLTANPAEMQSAGNSVTFTAIGQGSTTYEYEFYFWNGSTWSIVQNYSTSDSWIMPSNMAEGTYAIQVNVRGAGRTVESDASTRINSYRITAPPATGVTLAATPSGSQTAGNTVSFTAMGQGSTGYEFQFWLYNGTEWALAQDYGTADTWVMPAATPAGSYTVQVNVRGTDRITEQDSFARLNYQITP